MPGNHRSEGQTIFFRGGDADGAEGSAVEGVRPWPGCGAWATRTARAEVGGIAAVETREFQSAFDGFRCRCWRKRRGRGRTTGLAFARAGLERRCDKDWRSESRAPASRRMTLTMRGCAWPSALTAMPPRKSRYFLPRRVINVAAAAVGEDDGLAFVGRAVEFIGSRASAGPAFAGTPGKRATRPARERARLFSLWRRSASCRREAACAAEREVRAGRACRGLRRR